MYLQYLPMKAITYAIVLHGVFGNPRYYYIFDSLPPKLLHNNLR